MTDDELKALCEDVLTNWTALVWPMDSAKTIARALLSKLTPQADAEVAEIEKRHAEWYTPEKRTRLIGLTWAAGDQAHDDRATLLRLLRARQQAVTVDDLYKFMRPLIFRWDVNDNYGMEEIAQAIIAEFNVTRKT